MATPDFPAPRSKPRRGPETHHSQPTRYPFKLKDGCPVAAGLQFFADVRLGRNRQNSILFVGDVGAAAGERTQSNRRSPAAPNADRGCSGTSKFGL